MIREIIAAEARSWIDTPFYPHQAIKGIGADCVQLARAIFINVGYVESSDVVFPEYKLADADHNKTSKVIEWLTNQSWLEKTEDHSDITGCLITFKVGKVQHHVAVGTGKTTFVHSIRKYGVIQLDLRDSTWSSRLQTVWKPKG